jgi:hypothetical protein
MVLKAPKSTDELSNTSALFMQVMLDGFARWCLQLFRAYSNTSLSLIQSYVIQLQRPKDRRFYFAQNWIEAYEATEHHDDESLTQTMDAFS